MLLECHAKLTSLSHEIRGDEISDQIKELQRLATMIWMRAVDPDPEVPWEKGEMEIKMTEWEDQYKELIESIEIYLRENF